ncbi:hypothetical protein LINPERHAP1_LOCUS16461 [Linum perenne]
MMSDEHFLRMPWFWQERFFVFCFLFFWTNETFYTHCTNSNDDTKALPCDMA